MFLKPEYLIDPAILKLQAIGENLAGLSVQTGVLPWHLRIKAAVETATGKLIADYVDRRDNHGCDPNQEIITGAADEEEKLERGLPEACQEIAKPVKQLAIQLRNWRNTFNRCGTGAPRDAFNDRMTKKMRNIRKRAYKRLGCDSRGNK